MRIWPTASAHLRVDTLRRKDTQIEEHIRGDNGPGYSLRARRAECSTRATLANITGPSSDRSSVSSGFRYASYANPGEFRIPEISQRGSQPSVAPVALRSLPLRPYFTGVNLGLEVVHQRAGSPALLGARAARWPGCAFLHARICPRRESDGNGRCTNVRRDTGITRFHKI